jgi:predicted RNase H-like HicB family nuclease
MKTSEFLKLLKNNGIKLYRNGGFLMTKYLFPAIFTPETDGQYSVIFPNIESCYTQGDNLKDAYEMAKDALCFCLYNMDESNTPIPAPSAPNNIKKIIIHLS